MTFAITGSTRRRCARALRPRVTWSMELVAREDARGAVAVERDDLVRVSPTSHLHARRTGGHPGYGDSRDLRLLFQQPLNVGGRHVALVDVPANERRVARMQTLGDTPRLLGALHVGCIPDGDFEAVLAQVLHPLLTTTAVRVLEDRDARGLGRVIGANRRRRGYQRHQNSHARKPGQSAIFHTRNLALTGDLSMRLPSSRRGSSAVAAMFAVSAAQLPAQTNPSSQRVAIRVDTARASQLYVSNRPDDHPQRDHARDVAAKARTDSIYRARSRGVMDFQKISYRSSVDGMTIPAYLFQPLSKRGARGHAAMVWIHGGVHGDWNTSALPFVREAVERGYVVIAPEYRGSTGYGAAHYNAIDYGGKEVDDVLSAVDVLRGLSHVDPDRLGIMGWSHGGFIAAHLLFRTTQPFQGGAAIVPVTNLFVRLSHRGPGYQRSFATQAGIGGLPHEN